MNACVAYARAVCLGLVLSAAGSTAGAQTETFDLVSYNPPAGWKAVQNQDHVTFTMIDDAARGYVMLAVYSSAPALGDAEKDFAGEWRDVVQKSFSGVSPRSVAGRSAQGLLYREGSADVKGNSGNPLRVRLLAFSTGKRRFSVLMVATDQSVLEKQRAITQQFLDSLKLVPQGAVASSQAPSLAPGAGAAPRPGSGLSGVWMGFKQLYGYEPSPRWYTFFADGQVFEDIPRTGFVGFNRGASQSDSGQRSYWGTYSFANGSGSIVKPGVRYPEAIQSEGAGRIKLDSDHFYRCVEVDGLHLQGAWTSLANPKDPDLDRWPVGQRPIFRFTSDGKFVDEGVFATFLKSGDARLDAAGGGTYEIRDFTLLLRYSDGRLKQVAITGMLGANPATSNDMLFISRSRFRKRN